MNQLLHEMFINMSFPKNLAKLRKKRGLTQENLSELVGLTKIQIYRYEKGSSQPTLEILKKLAINLNISLDELVFDKKEREPNNELKLRFELIQQMNEEDQKTVKSLLDGMILKHQTKMTMGNFEI